MNILVLDASVLLKFTLCEQEQDVDVAKKILEQYIHEHILIYEPPLWKFEVANVLVRKLKNTHEALQALSFFHDLEFEEEDSGCIIWRHGWYRK